MIPDKIIYDIKEQEDFVYEPEPVVERVGYIGQLPEEQEEKIERKTYEAPRKVITIENYEEKYPAKQKEATKSVSTYSEPEEQEDFVVKAIPNTSMVKDIKPEIPLPTFEDASPDPYKEKPAVDIIPNLEAYYCSKCVLNKDCDYKTPNATNTDSPYHLYEGKKLCPLKDNRFNFKIIQCGDKWVSDGIREDYESWKSESPVFISAGTGSGKNHFIESKLIEYVHKSNLIRGHNKKILILSNRIALRKQQANRIKLKGGDKVLSYQSFLYEINNLRKAQQEETSKYSYVICDEAHFFTADSMFNPHTDQILSAIVKIFANAVRIYMTATPYECLRYIATRERIKNYSYPDYFDNKYFEGKLDEELIGNKQISDYNDTPIGFAYYKKGPDYDNDTRSPEDKSPSNMLINVTYYETNSPKMYYYYFSRDYSYLNIKYYSDYDDLNDLIVESTSKGEKWIIFIDNINKCKSYKNKLAEKNVLSKDDILVITSEIKKYEQSRKKSERTQYRVYEDMITDESFEQKVLICTSVIDNGINLKDTNLKHIVVSDINKDKVLQMVGRVRIDKGDTVTLYMKTFNKQYIKDIINSLEKKIDAYQSWEIAYNNLNDYVPDIQEKMSMTASGIFKKKFIHMLLHQELDFEVKKSPYIRECNAYDKYCDSQPDRYVILPKKFKPFDIHKRQDERKKFINKYYRGQTEDFEIANNLFFGCDEIPELVHPNNIAYSLVCNILLDRYESILDVISKPNGEIQYLQFQLSWFGKTYSEENWVTFDKKEKKK